jgi:hypothetical protein
MGLLVALVHIFSALHPSIDNQTMWKGPEWWAMHQTAIATACKGIFVNDIKTRMRL